MQEPNTLPLFQTTSKAESPLSFFGDEVPTGAYKSYSRNHPKRCDEAGLKRGETVGLVAVSGSSTAGAGGQGAGGLEDPAPPAPPSVRGTRPGLRRWCRRRAQEILRLINAPGADIPRHLRIRTQRPRAIDDASGTMGSDDPGG